MFIYFIFIVLHFYTCHKNVFSLTDSYSPPLTCTKLVVLKGNGCATSIIKRSYNKFHSNWVSFDPPSLQRSCSTEDIYGKYKVFGRHGIVVQQVIFSTYFVWFYFSKRRIKSLDIMEQLFRRMRRCVRIVYYPLTIQLHQSY